MFKLKKDDYLASLNRARRKRNRGDYKKYALIAAGAVVIIGAVCILGPYYHWRKQEKENTQE